MAHSGSSSLTRRGHLYAPSVPRRRAQPSTYADACLAHQVGSPGEGGEARMDELLNTHGPTLLHESSLSTIWRAPWNSPGAHES